MVLLRHGWRTDGRFFKLTRTWGDAAHWRAAVGPSNRSSRSKLTFALIRVSCEIQKSERARLLVAPDKARRPLPPLLFAVACSNTTDGGTADLARVLRLAPADARFWAYCRAASRAVVDFSLSTGGKEGGNRSVVCLIPG